MGRNYNIRFTYVNAPFGAGAFFFSNFLHTLYLKCE
jgi:hypothetical protein